MPVEGYKSITVKKDVYDYLMDQYKKAKKEWLIKKGINSFTGYVTYQLNLVVEEQMKENHQHSDP
jgi:hypothetical protein